MHSQLERGVWRIFCPYCCVIEWNLFRWNFRLLLNAVNFTQGGMGAKTPALEAGVLAPVGIG